MNIRNIITGLLIGGAVSAVSAQEYDDLYFNADDRAKLKASRSEAYAMSDRKKQFEEAHVDELGVNPTDSYSARKLNPEYVSRQQSATAREDEKDYFVENFAYNRVAQYNNWNNSFNNWYASPWYNNGFYGSGFNRFSSFYGYGYDPFSPWGMGYGGFAPGFYDPFYGPYAGTSAFWGGGSSFGWGMGFGYSWGRPMGGWYNPYAWGGGFYNNFWYPGNRVVVINNGEGNGRQVTSGKRGTRSTGYYETTRPARTRDNTAPTYSNYNRTSSGGRATTPSQLQRTARQEAYYNKNWRGSSQGIPTRSGSSSEWSGSSPTRSSGYDRSSGSNYNSGRSATPAPSYTPSRSSGGSSGSGSNGRTRGRD